MSKNRIDSLSKLKSINTICFSCPFHELITSTSIIASYKKEMSYCDHPLQEKADYYLERPYLCKVISKLRMIYSEEVFLKDIIEKFGLEAAEKWEQAKKEIKYGKNYSKQEEETAKRYKKGWEEFLYDIEMTKKKMIKEGKIGFTPPFNPDLLKKMISTPFKELVNTYKTNDLKKLEIFVKKDYKDKTLCLPFGDRRIYPGYDLGFHLGTDYFLPEGTPIYAITEGEILTAENRMRYPIDWGNLVITKTNNGLYIFYAHIDIEKSIKRKTKIQQGQLIGKVAKAWTKNNGNWPEHFHIQISKINTLNAHTLSKENLKNFINPEIFFPIKKQLYV